MYFLLGFQVQSTELALGGGKDRAASRTLATNSVAESSINRLGCIGESGESQILLHRGIRRRSRESGDSGEEEWGIRGIRQKCCTGNPKATQGNPGNGGVRD